MLSSLFSRDPKANFGFELPSEHFYQKNGIYLGNSFKKVSKLTNNSVYLK